MNINFTQIEIEHLLNALADSTVAARERAEQYTGTTRAMIIDKAERNQHLLDRLNKLAITE